MPPLSGANKSKNKLKGDRHSRSRNTTPSSVIGATVVPSSVPSTTPFLELDTSKLLVSSPTVYADILERLDTKPSHLDPRVLQETIDQLKQLNDYADKRAESCEKAIRIIHEQLRDLEYEHKERERQADHDKRLKAKKTESASKNLKPKKRKDRLDPNDVDIKQEDDAARSKLSRNSITPGPTDTPSPSKKIKHSPGTSSLSDIAGSPKPDDKGSPAPSDVSMEEDNRVLHAAPSNPPRGFFPDPLAPDPIIYHIRDVTPDMTEEEKKEIFSVTSYPTRDLSDQIAGTIPDKDFSNAKPTNQIAANTFLTFVEPYVRPLAEEDMAFLRERGDRITPFLTIPRNKRHWTEMWADEDGHLSSDHNDRNSTAPRGSADQIDEDNASTDAISAGPLVSRLMSLLKFEHRSTPADTGNEPNAFTGDDTMDLDALPSLTDSSDKPPAPAAAVADLAGPKTSSQKLDYVQSDDRIRAELRHLGLLGSTDHDTPAPDYNAHHDDDISERLRLLQAELRRVMVVNGARKARLLDLAKERLAYQEYSTIHDDLDSQVQQAYLKRTRTLGKTKKGPGGGKPKPGLASVTNLGGGFNRARDIGDSARMLMDRRKRWQSCIGPVFKDMKHGIPTADQTIWEQKVLEGYEKAEVEAIEEEGE